MPPTPQDVSYAICQDAVSAELDGAQVLLNVSSGEYFGLNEVGALIWRHLDPSRTVGELCAVVRGEYDVDEATCLADTEALLDSLLAHGLIRRC